MLGITISLQRSNKLIQEANPFSKIQLNNTTYLINVTKADRQIPKTAVHHIAVTKQTNLTGVICQTEKQC